MSAPIAAGGRTFTITIAPQMLTEYATDAPLLIINTSDQLVWLAASSSVGPLSGVPLQPQTSIPWAARGQVWAVLDPAAHAQSATVLLSSAVGQWTPSPAAIAQRVADYRDSRPLTWISATTPPAAAGVAQVAIATVTDPLWLVYRAVISCSSITQSGFGLYAGAATPANLRDATSLGNSNSADMASPLQFHAGEQIIARWSDCSDGATGSINLAYRAGPS